MREFVQAYVALSRARTLAGMCLTAFNPSAISADPIVKEFRVREVGVIFIHKTTSQDKMDTKIPQITSTTIAVIMDATYSDTR